MSILRPLKSVLAACALGLCLLLPASAAASSAASSVSAASGAAARRDGQHDFDFEIGVWKTHLKRLLHPLTGSSNWVELETDAASGHLEVLSLRLYDPQARQWSLNTANAKSGTLSVPTIGEFKDGRGEFFDQESFNGRTILVRNVWSDITADSCRFEQSFSEDGGKTWEVNWIAVDTRVK